MYSLQEESGFEVGAPYIIVHENNHLLVLIYVCIGLIVKTEIVNIFLTDLLLRCTELLF